MLDLTFIRKLHYFRNSDQISKEKKTSFYYYVKRAIVLNNHAGMVAPPRPALWGGGVFPAPPK